MSGARIFGHDGVNVWPGGSPLVPAELLDLPACRVIHDATRAWDGTVDAVVVLGDADELPPSALAHVVAALDRGEAIAVHGSSDAAVTVAMVSACTLAGGGNA
jgi:hypothetical protein